MLWWIGVGVDQNCLAQLWRHVATIYLGNLENLSTVIITVLLSNYSYRFITIEVNKSLEDESLCLTTSKLLAR
mgnify:CR=1 FL=1